MPAVQMCPGLLVFRNELDYEAHGATNGSWQFNLAHRSTRFNNAASLAPASDNRCSKVGKNLSM